MKQKDIALILVMVFIGAVIAFLISHVAFSSSSSRKQSAEVVDVITPSFPTPPSKYFNGNAVDISQPVTLGTNSDTQQ
jgi:hypothetical protein